METRTEQTIDQLNMLLTKNYDAEAGYKKAADDVEDAQLKRFFHDAAQQRYEFGHSIKSEIKQLGGKPSKGTSLAGTVHRAWMDIKSTVMDQPAAAILEECERGERATIEDYHTVLDEPSITGDTEMVLQQQLENIKERASYISDLRNRYQS